MDRQNDKPEVVDPDVLHLSKVLAWDMVENAKRHASISRTCASTLSGVAQEELIASAEWLEALAETFERHLTGLPLPDASRTNRPKRRAE